MSNEPAAGPAAPKSGPNLNPWPKERFQAKASNLSNHRALVESEAFERAIDTALLQAQRSLSSANQYEDMKNGIGMIYINWFVDILKNLSEKPQPVKFNPPSDNLVELPPRRN